MKALLAVCMAIVCVAAVVFAQTTEGDVVVSQPDPVDELAASVARGMALFNDPGLGTNGMTCNSCHMAGGAVDGGMGEMKIRAFDHLSSQFPKYWRMSGRVMTLDQAVNFCVVNPLKGTALAWDSQELTDLVAYCASVEPAAPVPERTEPGQ